ncbi:Stk1 family PASTA domain-containing Ser/Thr kinase [Actinotignum urinale]|uniref:non-specific serine/threonine protein kinase n=1 Tax=Actinotignum urinale TaxID=190146 RepID=A0AAW9HWB8_9ACTO|nr:Stk1 family PASTA domain-containing Ser/Thr kinase [Actinotignum urinale]MDY5151206.1 Stk1 family PASTA domain-containing Ser/Thr kinase [Actinotignum urinale]MDY5155174.1 Stk1 family PASTA domain-containing Ser/Thr kinase [Actinotignum urinale]WIK59582.1 Stk1 family PASTA domain-containing Ser/Thr kinase [Actinotignum urinale]
MSDIPTLLGNRYEVGDLIGRGGMAEVHSGYDTRLSRTVAIKILRSDLAQDAIFLARFRREAQSAAALNHPSIVSVYDTGEEQTRTFAGREISMPYIVMEYVRGRTVASLLKNGNPVPINEAVQIVLGVLSALEYSHFEGIIHRDIKPGNIMLTTDGKVKVMDFGIARAIADSAATMTSTNSVVGTAQYLSPEQARGEVVDARSDLYSTGCVLYELLTGKPPFQGDSAVAVAYQHVSEQPRPASSLARDIPDTIDRVVMKSLAKNRDDRYQTAAAFRADLLAAARGEGVVAPAVDSWNPYAVHQNTNATQAMPTATRILPSGQPHGTGTYPSGSPYAQTATNMEPQTGEQPAVKSSSKKKKKQSNVGLWIMLGVICLAILGVAGWFVLAGPMSKPEPTPTATTVEKVRIPDVSNMTENQVRQQLELLDLKFVRGTDVADDNIEKEHAVRTSPEIGTSVEKGSRVTVHFSTGPSSATVPNIIGMTTEQASEQLKSANLELGSVQQVDDPSQNRDRIVSVEPAVGTQTTPGSKVNVKVATGRTTMPDILGKTPGEADKALREAKLSLGSQTEKETTNPTMVGRVIDTSAQAGSSLSANTQVNVVIGKQASAPTSTPSPRTTAQPN